MSRVGEPDWAGTAVINQLVQALGYGAASVTRRQFRMIYTTNVAFPGTIRRHTNILRRPIAGVAPYEEQQ
jgi:hypothetical protein